MAEQTSEVLAFDRKVLLHQAMENEALAQEVLGLFNQQLEQLKAKDWAKADLHFEMHTLKGSAAAVGALQLAEIARTWKDHGADLQARLLVAIARFQKAAK